jgi:cell division protein FtsL
VASAARELQYQHGSVYQNLAYDLDREIRETELRHAGELRREAAQPVTKVRSVSKPLVRQRQRVSVFSVLGFFSVAVMAVLVLFSYVQLTELSADVVDLTSQLSTLETDHATLAAQYQRMYDLSTVKEVAEAAGMTKPSSSQVYYVDLSDGDSAVVYRQEEPGVLSRLLTSLNHGVYAVLEYFK